MKSNGRFGMFLTVAMLAMSLVPQSASAQFYGGKFSLPFQARWSGVTLPAGEYKFYIDSIAPAGKIILQHDGKLWGMVMVGPGATFETAGPSKLDAVPSGNTYRIRALQIQHLCVINFPPPKAERKATPPEFVLSARITSLANGK